MRLLPAVLVAALGLSACAAPYIQPTLTPPSDFAGPSVQDRALVMSDGARLPLMRWAPEGEPWAVIVALHGMNDHAASFRLAGPWWAEQGIETWAYDQRGFGAAPGRGQWAGQDRMTEDLREAVALARARHPETVIAVVGESMGGSVAAAAFGSDRPPGADRVVLLAPGVWGWSTQGWLNTAALNIAARMSGSKAVEPPRFIADRIQASSNVLELYRNGRDPESILSTRFDTLYGLVDLMETSSRRLGLIRAPAILMYGAHDEVVEKGPMRRALEQMPADAILRQPDGPLPSGAGPVLPQLEALAKR